MISDIYEVIDKLNSLCKDMKDKKENDSYPNVLYLKTKLEGFSKNPQVEEIKKHIQLINHTASKFPVYKKILKDIVDFLEKSEEDYRKSEKKYDSRKIKFTKLVALSKKHRGRMMLPIQAGGHLYHYRGVCQGQVAYFAKRFLSYKRINGINPEGDISFDPILTDEAAKNYLNINNMLPLTQEISGLQNQQKLKCISKFTLFGRMIFRNAKKVENAYPLSLDANEQKKFVLNDLTEDYRIKIKDGAPIIEKIIGLINETTSKLPLPVGADQSTSSDKARTENKAAPINKEKKVTEKRKTYHVIMYGEDAGHSILFAVDYTKDNKVKHIHFLDPCSAWYRFDSINDIENWFKDYFEMMNYKWRDSFFDYDLNRCKHDGFESFTMHTYTSISEKVSKNVVSKKTASDDIALFTKKKKLSGNYSKDDIDLIIRKSLDTPTTVDIDVTDAKHSKNPRHKKNKPL